MSFVAVAIGGSALVGAGASIYAGSQQASGAQSAADAQVAASGQANQTIVGGRTLALEQLAPYQKAGLRAGNALESLLYTPEQRAQQYGEIEQQRLAHRRTLKAEVQRLQGQLTSQPAAAPGVPVGPTGRPGVSVLRGTAVAQPTPAVAPSALQQQLDAAQRALRNFDAQTQQIQGRFTAPAPEIEASPWYQFQAELLGRTQDMAFAARGLTGSGFEAEERRRGLIELGAGETERQFGRLQSLYATGANAANAAAGAVTGTSQAIANNQIGAGQAQAQGAIGVAGANANALTGVANSVTGGVGAGLNYYQFQNLINANKPPVPTNASWASQQPINAYG